VLPLVAIAVVVVGLALAAVVAVPLLPLLVVGFLVWLLVRGTRSTAIAR
jgi:hypothetical protein